MNAASYGSPNWPRTLSNKQGEGSSGIRILQARREPGIAEVDYITEEMPKHKHGGGVQI